MENIEEYQTLEKFECVSYKESPFNEIEANAFCNSNDNCLGIFLGYNGYHSRCTFPNRIDKVEYAIPLRVKKFYSGNSSNDLIKLRN